MARVDPSVSCLASPLGSSYPSRFFSYRHRSGWRGEGRSGRLGRRSLFLPVARAFYSRITIDQAGRGARREMMRGHRFIQLDFSETNK